MNRRAWRLGVTVGAVTVGAVAAAATAYALVASNDDSGPANAAPTTDQSAPARVPRESPFGGVVARLPYVGTLTWRCDEQRRFSTKLTLPSPGASIYVSVEADGARVWRRRRVDPTGPERTVVGPFRALNRQTWTIRFHHKPATLRVVGRLRFAAPRSRSQCVVSRADIQMRRAAH